MDTPQAVKLSPLSLSFPFNFIALLALSATFLCAAPLRAEAQTVAPAELPRVGVDTAMPAVTGRVISVPSGGDLQAALNSAQPGDAVELQAGATYVGEFVLPYKGEHAGWIIVRTSAWASLPAEGTRVTPAHSALMPKILSPGRAARCLVAERGAHHYRFIGVEFAPVNETADVRNLVWLGDETVPTVAELPHHITLDRCYLHGLPASEQVRAVAFNGAHMAIVNSWVSDIHHSWQDSQAVWGSWGPGPFLIENNYLEAAGENVMFGGSGPVIPGVVPSDITVRRNHFSKPWSWRVGHPSYAGRDWSVKNLFETKNAQRVLIEGNLFENSWRDSQTGVAILLKTSDHGGHMPWAVAQDITVRSNVIRRAATAIQMAREGNGAPVRRIRIENNLAYDISRDAYGPNTLEGCFIGSEVDADDVAVEQNTVVDVDNKVARIGTGGVGPHRGLAVRNNVFARGGAMGWGLEAGLTEGLWAFRNWGSDWVYQNNAMFGSTVAPDTEGRYPAGNFFSNQERDSIFVDPANEDYRLKSDSPWRGRAPGGKDLGCDIQALRVAMGLATANPTPTPTPTPTATPTPTPTATPTPTPSPTPTPTPGPGGKSRDALERAKRNAQVVSNQLAAAQAAGQSPGTAGSVAESTSPQISLIVSDLELTFNEFRLDRSLYPASARIEVALTAALEQARAAATAAQEGLLAEVKVKLRRAIDNLEVAAALMAYGDIQNPIDTPEYFVRQHYVDFLDREPDSAGLAYWVGQITSCGQNRACVESNRINVSAAFFLSIEFQKTGYLVHRVYRAAYGRTPLLAEFGADTEEVSGGVIVGTPGWEAILDANTREYFERLARRGDFKARYDALTNEQFVSSLLANAGVTLPAPERDALLRELNTSGSRAVAVRRVVESAALAQKEKNPAFVEMQYFGYMRRDFDQAGFQFWLQKLVNHNGDHVSAQMVKSFLDSGEYRGRFPQR